MAYNDILHYLNRRPRIFERWHNAKIKKLQQNPKTLRNRASCPALALLSGALLLNKRVSKALFGFVIGSPETINVMSDFVNQNVVEVERAN